ncbi:MAG: hypothetical protein A2381_05945 [Bdellovibrionales bacterium RIFOXYB1_FULL_37_110]|nr:MAG: hypothetical protein A2417_04830 [Bdellovibrionales bacterium RIFOXYC1_FULL_37_79]OFZ59362.1 MAG: hypothetical protein A2381_05945 [Bdellovibrionales bacterium RIFOXYB1_FULL_37_110]OFZ61922.1 MAG: hypothetical protein A2577_17830 [Bdellovibrionales bacterium RIFOXYD1_FULL_36_51]
MNSDNKLPHWADILASNVLGHLRKQNLTHLSTIVLWLNDNKTPSVIRKIVTFELLVKALKTIGMNSLNPHICFMDAPESDEVHCKNIVTKLSTFISPDATSNYELNDAIYIKFNPDENCHHILEQNSTVILPDVQVRLKGLDLNHNSLPIYAILDCFETDLIRWLISHQSLNTSITFHFDEEITKLYKLFDENEARYFNQTPNDTANFPYEHVAYKYAYIHDAIPPSRPFRPDFLKLSTLLQMYDLDISSAYAYHIHLLKNDLDKSCFSKRSEKIYNWLRTFAPASCKFSVNKHPINVNLNEKELSFMKNVFNFIKSYEDEVEFEDLDEIGKRFEMFSKEKGMDFSHAKTVLYRHLINKNEGPTFSSFVKYLDRNKLLMLLRK